MRNSCRLSFVARHSMRTPSRVSSRFTYSLHWYGTVSSSSPYMHNNLAGRMIGFSGRSLQCVVDRRVVRQIGAQCKHSGHLWSPSSSRLQFQVPSSNYSNDHINIIILFPPTMILFNGMPRSNSFSITSAISRSIRPKLLLLSGISMLIMLPFALNQAASGYLVVQRRVWLIGSLWEDDFHMVVDVQMATELETHVVGQILATIACI